MEIERKFFVSSLPEMVNRTMRHYRRYYISVSPVEKRIQQVDDTYYYEEKQTINSLRSKKTMREISEREFMQLKRMALPEKAIIRDSIELPDEHVSLKIYHGKYEGLVRAEIEFSSVEEAKAYTKLDWMGKEITNSPLGKDSHLIMLSSDEFNHEIEMLKGKS